MRPRLLASILLTAALLTAALLASCSTSHPSTSASGSRQVSQFCGHMAATAQIFHNVSSPDVFLSDLPRVVAELDQAASVAPTQVRAGVLASKAEYQRMETIPSTALSDEIQRYAVLPSNKQYAAELGSLCASTTSTSASPRSSTTRPN